MADKQTEDELLGLDSSPHSGDAGTDKTENVDDIEAEILLLSSMDTVSKSPVKDPGKEDEELEESVDNDGEVKLNTELSSIKGGAAGKVKADDVEIKLGDNNSSSVVLDDDDLLLGDDESVEISSDKDRNLLNKDGSSKRDEISDKEELKSGELSKSLILVEDDNKKTETKSSVEISTNKKTLDTLDSSLVILDDDADDQKSDSVMEVIDDDDDPPSRAKKRKSNVGDNSQSAVEIIDDEDYDDDELEILDGSESDLGSDMSEGEESNSFCEGKICIFWSNGSLFVWNAEDAQMLREECRIVGKLTGCLPRAPRQNNHLGLPLQLMPEEARLLVDIDAAVVVQEDVTSTKARKARERGFKSVREDNVKLQIKMYKESRKEEVKQKMGDIIAGKKAKRQKLQKKNKKGKNVDDQPTESSDMDTEEKSEVSLVDDPKDTSVDSTGEGDSSKVTVESDGASELEDSLTVEDIIKEDTETHAKHTLVQIFTENPWKRSYVPASGFHFPVTERDTLRYTVFKDLWKKGYYLTTGAKFGGDFLVYPGDPARYHSHYIAVCLGHQSEVPVLGVVSMGRLASNVRKTTLLCSLSQRRKKVLYTSLQWTGIS